MDTPDDEDTLVNILGSLAESVFLPLMAVEGRVILGVEVGWNITARGISITLLISV